MTENGLDHKNQKNQPDHGDLRLRIKSILGADRWIKGDYPTVAPVNAQEIARLLRGYSGSVLIVGSGTSFPDDFNPGSDTLILITNLLKEELEISDTDQTITVSVGWQIRSVNEELKKAGFIVPSLARFDQGTVGGRLASVTSRPSLLNTQGWIQGLLGIEVVLPSGEQIRLGGRCIKDVAGYDLKHFFTGSRGVIGVIVKAVFRCQSYLTAAETVNPDTLPETGNFDTSWKKLFDPFDRMKRGS